jgi:hypothetical protein
MWPPIGGRLSVYVLGWEAAVLESVGDFKSVLNGRLILHPTTCHPPIYEVRLRNQFQFGVPYFFILFMRRAYLYFFLSASEAYTGVNVSLS